MNKTKSQVPEWDKGQKVENPDDIYDIKILKIVKSRETFTISYNQAIL